LRRAFVGSCEFLAVAINGEVEPRVMRLHPRDFALSASADV
jgi:hypothetical protein